MVFNFMSDQPHSDQPSLSELELGERGIVTRFCMSPQVAEHLMNLGFIPGLEVMVARSGPGGDPRVYRVDGTEVALRRDLSRCIFVRPVQIEQAAD
jgi:ferrous iron transport protein A